MISHGDVEVRDGTGAFEMGRYLGVGGYWDGLLDALYLSKGQLLDSTERAALYNSGSGLEYPFPM